MVTRNSLLAACALLCICTAFGQNSYVFQLPGVSSSAQQIIGRGDNDFSRIVQSTTGPTGSFQVVATPTGSKFYVLGATGVYSAPVSLSSFTQIAANGVAATQAVVSPDGKFLLVVADHFYIIDTSNDKIVGSDVGITGGTTPRSVAVSRDSSTAWILADNGITTYLSAVNLGLSPGSGAQLILENLGSVGTSVTLSPKGLLYLTFSDHISEINPVGLTPTAGGTITLDVNPGPVRITPDGSTAYMLNIDARTCTGSCYSMAKVSLTSRSVSYWPPRDGSVPNPPAFDDIFIAGNTRIFGFAGSQASDVGKRLYDITPSPFGAAPSTLSNVLSTQVATSIAVSTERPSARFLYLFMPAINSPLVRWNLLSDGIDFQTSANTLGQSLWYTPIPPQTGASGFYSLNTVQNLAAGSTSAPLISQVIDSAGRPVFNAQVCFTTDVSSGLVIASASQRTNSEGYVQTAIIAPTAAGTYTVTLTAAPCGSSGASTTFSITVGGSQSGGSPQFTIYSGDGQLMSQNTGALQPLTVKATDADGNPLADIDVTFEVADEASHGRLVGGSSSTTTTGSDGLASATFFSGTVPTTASFLSSHITATSVLGSVTFAEVTYNASFEGTNRPRVTLKAPENGELIVNQGEVQFGAIKGQSLSAQAGQFGFNIPDVGIRLADRDQPTSNSSVLSCQGPTRGDSSGISQCDVLAGCQVTGSLPFTTTIIAAIGEYAFSPVRVTIQQGRASKLSKVSGDNQTGFPGTRFTLQARVTDGCNQRASGAVVSWSVIQGTGTLSNNSSTSLADGTVSTQLTLGGPGTIQVRASANNINPIIFQITSVATVSGIGLVSGGGQSVIVGQAFPNPVVFAVRDTSNNPVPNVAINVTVSGNATITSVVPASGLTDAQGQVRVTLIAGPTPGTISVTAASSGFSTTANLSSHLQGPDVVSTSFTNAASGAVGMVPCGLVTVTGNGIAPTPGLVSGQGFFGQLPFTLSGLSITVQQGANNIPAPIHSVINDQYGQRANFQAPCELTAGAATVVVTVNNVSTTVSAVPVFTVQPGLFVAFLGSNNQPYAYVYRASDNSPVTTANPAHRGEQYYIIITGMGLVTPATTTNAIGTGSQNVNLPVLVGLSDRDGGFISARYLAGYIGAYRIDFRVPLDSPLGSDRPLAIAAILNGGVNGFSDYKFGNPVFLPAVAP